MSSKNIILIVLGLSVVSGGLFWSYQQQKNLKEKSVNNTIVETRTTNQATNNISSEQTNNNGVSNTQSNSTNLQSPKQVYTQYLKEIQASRNYTDILVVLKKYGTKSIIDSELKQNFSSPEDRQGRYDVIHFIFGHDNSPTTKIEEKIEGNVAKLTVSYQYEGKLQTVYVTMQMENGQWKFNDEQTQ